MAARLKESFFEQPWHLRLLELTLGGFLLCVAVAIPSQASASWFLIGAITSIIYLIQARRLNDAATTSPPSVFATMLLFLWLLACATATTSFFAVLVAAGFNRDEFTDLLGSLAVTILTIVHMRWRSEREVEPSKTPPPESSSLSAVSQCCCGGLALFGIVVILLDGFGRITSLLVHPPVSFVNTPLGAIHYYCEGTVTNNTVMIFEAGFMAPSSTLFFVQEGLKHYTRTCLYDRSGEGFSQAQEDVGFIGEARNMKAVLDEEFNKAGVATGDRNVVVGGHSRGFQSAARFKVDYDASYNRVVVVELDGATCSRDFPADYIPADVLIYLLPSFTSMVSGLGWVLWPFIKEYALTDPFSLGGSTDANCPAELQVGDLKNEGEYLQRLVKPNLWRNTGHRDNAWRDRPALTSTQCSNLVFSSPDYIGILRGDVSVVGLDNLTLCTSSHTAIVMRSDYASIVTQRITDFLDTRALT